MQLKEKLREKKGGKRKEKEKEMGKNEKKKKKIRQFGFPKGKRREKKIKQTKIASHKVKRINNSFVVERRSFAGAITVPGKWWSLDPDDSQDPE